MFLNLSNISKRTEFKIVLMKVLIHIEYIQLNCTPAHKLLQQMTCISKVWIEIMEIWAEIMEIYKLHIYI